MPRMEAGDEIVLTIAEHHANIVPWHFLRERQGVVLKWVDVDANGDLDPQAVIDAIGRRRSWSRSAICRTCWARSST
jgi:cysteine desulfurase/selenocysteine lyase